MCINSRRFAKRTAIVLAAAISPAVFAATPVFVDHFTNGSVADSDTTPGFWNTIIDQTGTAVENAGGPLTLTATGASPGDQFPFTQVSSALQNSFNFFRSPIVLQASGLGYAAGSSNVALTQFNFTSQGLQSSGPLTEYEAQDGFTLWVSNIGNPNGNVLLGIKEDAPNNSTAFNGYPLIGPIGNHAGKQTYAGQVRSFKLTLAPTFYDLVVTHDTSTTDATPVSAHYSGGLDIQRANTAPLWATAANSLGDSALNIETQLGGTSSSTAAGTFSVGQVSVSQFTESWLGPDGANWSDGANWADSDVQHPNGDFSTSNVPNFAGANVKFDPSATPRLVITDHDETLGAMIFDSAQPYTVTVNGGGEGTIHLASRYPFGELRVLQGSHSILSPVLMHQDAVINVIPAASVLTVPTLIAEFPATINVTKEGAGKLATSSLLCNALSINAGTVSILANGTTTGVSNVKALNIAGAANAWTGALDLTNNALVVDYTGTSPLATVANQIASARGAGAWNGNGITSANAAVIAANGADTHKTALGFAEAAALGIASFRGQTVDATAILVRYTYYGDSDLSGSVDSLDFNALAANFGATGKSWVQGDYNFDGKVDSLDFNALATNFGLTLPASAPALIGANVPEPTSILLAAIPLLQLRRRRR